MQSITPTEFKHGKLLLLDGMPYVIEDEWHVEAVVIRRKACGDNQHRDKRTQFQQPTSLSEPATHDQWILTWMFFPEQDTNRLRPPSSLVGVGIQHLLHLLLVLAQHRLRLALATLDVQGGGTAQGQRGQCDPDKRINQKSFHEFLSAITQRSKNR